jgi:hypothetical protein
MEGLVVNVKTTSIEELYCKQMQVNIEVSFRIPIYWLAVLYKLFHLVLQENDVNLNRVRYEKLFFDKNYPQSVLKYIQNNSDMLTEFKLKGWI